MNWPFMRVEIVPRGAAPVWLLALLPLLSVAITAGLAVLLFVALGYDAGRSFWAFFLLPLSSGGELTDLALKAAPLIMIAVGIALGMRAGVSNIGAEGQLIMGAIAGTGLSLALMDEESRWILPVSAVAAILGGMGWAAIPAFLRVRLGISEILTSLMLTYVAALLLSVLVFGPWRDPEGMNFPQSRLLSDAEMLPALVPGTRLHAGVLVALIVAVAGWFVSTRTVWGFALRVTGLAPAAARYAGFDADGLSWISLLVSGGLAGLAGFFEVAGPIGQLMPELTPGYGFTAIIVAFLGRLHPLGIIPAGFLVALSYLGGESAQVATGLPRSVTGIVQGLLLFLVLGSDFFVRHRVRLRFGSRVPA